MDKVRILIEGYAKEAEGKELATCTTTLIRSGKANILIDPGMNRELLLKALSKESLKPSDIDFVVLTHNHMDHMLLTGIFERAKVLDDSSVYTFKGEIYNHDGTVPGTDIQIIRTPGHDQFHCSVVVDTKEGKIVICSDVFWWSDDQEQKTDKASLMAHKDPYVKNKEQLDASRKRVLDLADWIIPGHGKMFKVKK